ncbi:hypothetical protein [Spongiivirga citrea]|uniref:Uncharacterized protein n=1 Tax=Spongiivirga citrea TaxID=1481457 RepID=A0A6M0CPF5_9FLAO|nr:hypothetical protein [Spongiivirga citrea]NER17749.1 hypothetical protein [Spongiivirga citrea]
MATIIYNKTKSHGNSTNILSGAGVDKIKIKIPSGQKFSHFTITPASGHSGVATFNVIKAPRANATGNQEIHVMWTNGPFSKCRYKLKVYSKVATAPSVKPVVIFGDRNWYSLATGYIKSRQPFTLRLQGADALKLFNVINPMNNAILRRGIVINEVVAVSITVAVCVTIVAVSGLAVLGAVLLYGIHQGCEIDGEFENGGNVTTGGLGQVFNIELMKCGG